MVGKEYVHMHIEYPPSLSVSQLVKRLKGRTSRFFQREFPKLSRRYGVMLFWAIGYGDWSSGNISEEVVQLYLEYYKEKPDTDDGNIILE